MPQGSPAVHRLCEEGNLYEFLEKTGFTNILIKKIFYYLSS